MESQKDRILKLNLKIKELKNSNCLLEGEKENIIQKQKEEKDILNHEIQKLAETVAS